MSQKSLYDFETEQIDKMFDCKNYLFKNSKHEKVILESDTGVKMVRHIRRFCISKARIDK